MFKNLPVEKPELLALGQFLGAARFRGILLALCEVGHADVTIGFYFTGKDLHGIAAHQTAFVLKAFGLATSYTGVPPASAHSALPPILEGHFDRRLKLLDELLEREGLSPSQRKAWIGFENAFRAAIVSRP